MAHGVRTVLGAVSMTLGLPSVLTLLRGRAVAGIALFGTGTVLRWMIPAVLVAHVAMLGVDQVIPLSWQAHRELLARRRLLRRRRRRQ